jgi:hypothetical protein
MITLPAADVTAATAVVTTAYDSRGGVDFSKNQALQLHRLLVSSG